MDARKQSRLYAAGLVMAVAVGVLLGNSAISEINPVHFRTQPVRLVEHEAPDPTTIGSTPFYRDTLSPAEAMLIRESLCPGCYGRSDVQTASYSSQVPYFGSREERAAIEARERRAIDGAYAAREQRREAARPPVAMGGPFEEAPAEAPPGADSGESSADRAGETA